MLMHQLLLDGAAREPGKVALRWIDRNKALTYAQSVEATAHFAGALHYLGVRAGDKLMFENDEGGIRVRPVRNQSTFSKYRGIGNPGIGPGRKGIARWLREMRGE